MVVKFDLRIRKDTSKTDSDRIYSALIIVAVIFLFCSFAVYCSGLYGIHSARERVTVLTKEQEALSEQLASLKTELSVLDSDLKDVEERAEFLITGLPACDFLSELTEILPDGVVVEELDLAEGKAMFRGVAENNRDIASFCEVLEGSSCVCAVGVPSISTVMRNGIEMRGFSVEVEMRTLQDVVLMRKGGATR